MSRDNSRPAGRPRVVYWTNAPAPYTVDRFNALAARDTLDFEVWFEALTQSGRDWDAGVADWRFTYRERPSLSALLRLRNEPTRPDLLVTLYYLPRMLAGAGCLHGRSAVGYVLDGPGDGWAPKRSSREWLKRQALSHADGLYCAGPETAEFAAGYGAARSRLFELPHSIDPRYLEAGKADVVGWRRALRNELQLDGLVFLYVGRLWQGKGIDALLDACARLPVGSEPVHLLVVGSGVDEAYYRHKACRLGLVNVHWVGFTAPQELIRYYAAADVFVFPSLGDPYGLVVDEAMAMGLPVIGSDAAGEMRTRIRGGENGYVVPAGDAGELAWAMQRFIDHPTLANELGHDAAEAMRGRHPAQWAEAFESAVFATLDKGNNQ